MAAVECTGCSGGAGAELAAKTAGLLALLLALVAGAEARRGRVHLAPKSAKATDGVVLARGAQFGGRGAVFLALLALLLARRSVLCLARLKVGSARGLAVSQDGARRRRGNRRRG